MGRFEVEIALRVTGTIDVEGHNEQEAYLRAKSLLEGGDFPLDSLDDRRVVVTNVGAPQITSREVPRTPGTKKEWEN